MMTLRSHGFDLNGGRLYLEVGLGDGWRCFCFYIIQQQPVLVEMRLLPDEPVPDFPPPNTDDMEIQAALKELGYYSTFPHGEWTRSPESLTDDHAAGITTALIRSVPLRRIAQEAYSGASEILARQANPNLLKMIGRPPTNPGRAGRDDRYYAVWAGRYVEALGRSNKPNEALARKHRKSPSAIRDLIHEARRRKLLTPATRGKAGGLLTDKAIALLKEGD